MKISHSYCTRAAAQQRIKEEGSTEEKNRFEGRDFAVARVTAPRGADDSDSEDEHEPWSPVYKNTRNSSAKGFVQGSESSVASVDALGDLFKGFSLTSNNTNGSKKKTNSRHSKGPKEMASSRQVPDHYMPTDAASNCGRYTTKEGNATVRRSRRLNH